MSLGDLISQHQMQINNLKASKCFLKDNLFSGNYRAKVAESQTQALVHAIG
jgi:hypothetical protein